MTVAEIREGLDIRWNTLAKMLDVSPSTVYQWRHGQRPGPGARRLLAQIETMLKWRKCLLKTGLWLPDDEKEWVSWIDSGADPHAGMTAGLEQIIRRAKLQGRVFIDPLVSQVARAVANGEERFAVAWKPLA